MLVRNLISVGKAVAFCRFIVVHRFTLLGFGFLDPEYKEVVQGRAEVRDLFKVPKIGIIAGCYVTDGKITRNAGLKLVRDSVVVFDGKILSLRRFKDDAKEVQTGFECGIGIDGYNDIHVGDIIEAYITEKLERKL